jgi:3-dehydroquinate synthase
MLQRTITIDWEHRVFFARDVFSPDQSLLAQGLLKPGPGGAPTSVLVLLDSQVAQAHPQLRQRIGQYAQTHQALMRLVGVVEIAGGESCKNDFAMVQHCWQAINDAGLDRHSQVWIIGGGAVLDLGCFAAATAHRGIRHVRFPTTTLSQGDGGVGVKNGVNFFGKKNWVGSFAVPHAVVNDFSFLLSLPPAARRDGIIEAIKVALIRDAGFYLRIEALAEPLAALEQAALEEVVEESARQHVEHIAGCGDPFELGSARPLDFGHWAAHKLEQITQFAVSHGQAVAVGMALDLRYSVRAGLLDEAVATRVLKLIARIGFALDHPALHQRSASGQLPVLEGLEEFREHLGGELTITLVPEIGRKLEVHEMDRDALELAMQDLRSGCGL